MTKDSFIDWLKGYIEGRLVLEPKYSYSEEMLKAIQKKLNEVDTESTTLLLDSDNPNTTIA